MDEMRPLTKSEAKTWSYADLGAARLQIIILTKTLRGVMKVLEDSMEEFDFYEQEYQDMEEEMRENRSLYKMLCSDIAVIESELIDREDAAMFIKKKNGVLIHYSLN